MASVEAKSEHPIAVAIVQAAEQQNISLLPITAFDSVTGLGIKAEVTGQTIHIGADRYMKQLELDVTPFENDAARLGQLLPLQTLLKIPLILLLQVYINWA